MFMGRRNPPSIWWVVPMTLLYPHYSVNCDSDWSLYFYLMWIDRPDFLDSIEWLSINIPIWLSIICVIQVDIWCRKKTRSDGDDRLYEILGDQWTSGPGFSSKKCPPHQRRFKKWRRHLRRLVVCFRLAEVLGVWGDLHVLMNHFAKKSRWLLWTLRLGISWRMSTPE